MTPWLWRCACLDESAHGHDRCKALATPSHYSPFPTRLIDCTDPHRPRLVCTAGSCGTYLTLSYVWGMTQPHCLTSANISAYIQGIEATRLPSTIRDAIQVTHSLGLQYLWADSLCIIQDSDEDKQREIVRMRRIYRNAHLTIIAASARTVAEGFLHDRPASSSPSERLAIPWICPVESGDRTVGGRQAGTAYLSPHIKDVTTSYSDLTNSPISERAWCMQEDLMALRSLIFTSHTLQFRCQSAICNVGGAYHYEDSWEPYSNSRLPDILLQPNSMKALGPYERRQLFLTWQRIVMGYSSRSVSFPSDKLVACAGIAEDFQRVLRSDYLAGSWRETLLEDLVWLSRDDDCAVLNCAYTRPVAYRAPSWSWASVDGKISFESYEDRNSCVLVPLAEVVRCNVTLVDDAHPFGQVAGGSLVLRAKLIQCER
ncbi:heterokaryon incompatibility protein-domain-containing protein [Trametes gibbosa]|nr:heterokaryon incompatibility protein-domain-containing protein [Trametes gibbosa]